MLVEPIAVWGTMWLHGAERELLLVASVGILIAGCEDLLFDALWLLRRRPHRAAHVAVDQRLMAGRIAVFVPAWQEAAVLADTLRAMLQQWADEDIRIFVGCYPNDAGTIASVAPLIAHEDRLRLVIARQAGPTSKADNLNQMWAALGVDERAEGRLFAAVVLHDAEDRVHADAIALFRRHLPGAMLVQIPVEPLLLPGGGPIAAHYADEFAEAHAKEMPLRAALGVALPAAGVGCAFSRAALTLLALGREQGPFHADSLTEDYEAGLVLSAGGGICRFVDEHGSDGARIATRSAFPSALGAAVRQKSRWIAGIALGAWDRLDWLGGRSGESHRAASSGFGTRLLIRWMLWRDRRSMVAALVVLCAYAGLVLAAIDLAGQWGGLWSGQPLTPALKALLFANALLLGWRLVMRAWFSGSIYGWRQGLLAIPRAFISNIIHILAARRALSIYLRQLSTRQMVWDKTVHHAPPLDPAPAAADATR